MLIPDDMRRRGCPGSNDNPFSQFLKNYFISLIFYLHNVRHGKSDTLGNRGVICCIRRSIVHTIKSRDLALYIFHSMYTGVQVQHDGGRGHSG